ncbi:hypothetical protein [Guggenheimella bovis]
MKKGILFLLIIALFLTSCQSTEKPVATAEPKVVTNEATKEPTKEPEVVTNEATKEPEVGLEKLPIDIELELYPIHAEVQNVKEFFGNSPMTGFDLAFDTLPAYKMNNSEEYEELKKRAQEVAHDLDWNIKSVADEAQYKEGMQLNVKAEEGEIFYSSYGFTVVCMDAKTDRVEILKKLGFKHPNTVEGRFDPHDTQSEVTFYDHSDDPVECARFYFTKVADSMTDMWEGKPAIFMNFLDQKNVEKIGDYKAISAKTAKEMLLSGKNLSNSVVKPEEKTVLDVELIYMVGTKSRMLPYYRFAVMTNDNPLVLDEYFVPALDPSSYNEELADRQEISKDLLISAFKPVKKLQIIDVQTKKELPLEEFKANEFWETFRSTSPLAYEKVKGEPTILYEVHVTYEDGEEVSLTFPDYSVTKNGVTSDYYHLMNKENFDSYFSSLKK